MCIAGLSVALITSHAPPTSIGPWQCTVLSETIAYVTTGGVACLLVGVACAVLLMETFSQEFNNCQLNSVVSFLGI